MVKLDKLGSFETYRTRPPVIMPETTSNRKKNQAFIVVAPTIEQEMKYLASNQVLKFRYLSKYFIDKRWDHTLYGKGRQVIKLNDDGAVNNLLLANSAGSLKDVKDITSYLPTSKSRPLKDFNVLVEANYATEMILSNEKDHRRMSIKSREWLSEIERIYGTVSSGTIGNYLGNYTCTMIIPLELWFTESELSNPMLLFKLTASNPMGHMLRMLSDAKTLSRFGNVVLVYGEFILILNASDVPTEAKSDYIMDIIIRYFRKFTTANNKIAYYDTPDETDEDIAANERLKAAEKVTNTELVTDSIMVKSGIDPDSKSREKVQTVVEKHINPDVNTPTISNDDNNVVVDLKDVVIKAPDDVDVLLTAKTEGKSVASVKRDQVLKEKYKELSIGNIPITNIIEEEHNTEIPPQKIEVHTVNPALKEIKSTKFESTYNASLMTKDMTNILMHFSHVVPVFYLNKDVEVIDVSTPTDRILRYTVQFEDTDRKRHRFSFKMPKIYQDRYLYLNDQKMNIVHQKFPYPVTKVSPDRCQAVSNYKKIFTERYGGNLSPRIARIKKAFTGPNCPRMVSIVPGNCTTLNTMVMTTIEYDELANSIVKMDIGKSGDSYTFYFSVSDARSVISMDNFSKKMNFLPDDGAKYLIPLAVHRQRSSGKAATYYAVSGKTNQVYDSNGKQCGELSEFIVSCCENYDKTLADEFATISTGTKFVYSRSKIMGEWVPTVLMLAAADPGGLTAVLQKAKIQYTFLEKRPTDLDKDLVGIIPFSDGYLTFDRYPYEKSLLMNGLSSFPSKEYSFYDMDTYDAYVQIFDGLFNSKAMIDALRNFYYMFVDPITMEVLIKLNMPTNFTDLLLFCNDILADNTYQIDSDYHNSRLRSNEIMLAQLYCELANAWSYYVAGKAEKFSIPEDCIVKYMLTSNIVDPHSQLNLVLEMENDRQVKLKGPSGMNEDHSFTLEKRAFHPSMAGIIGMNSTPSGSVGIDRHLTLNANITDARGFVEVDKPEYDGSELATPGEMLQPFGVESSDVERLAMALSQSKHVVPVADSCSPPVTYDMERVAPYLSNDFTKIAKKDGYVKSIKDNIMIIEYNDKTIDDIDLSVYPAKNTDGGFYIMNQLQPTVKVGERVKAETLVAIDPKYINQYDMFGDPLCNVGTMGRIAIVTNGGVYEDSCTITDNLAHRMATRITRQKRVILSKYANIKHIVSTGTDIKANDPLLTFDDTRDEFTSGILAAIADEADDSDEMIATNAPVLSKVTGTVKAIDVCYSALPEEMSDSLRSTITKLTKEAQIRKKELEKSVGNIYDANIIIPPVDRLIPDSGGKIRGTKCPDGVIIDFYIEYEDVMAPGDKISYLSALKGIVSDIIPDDLAPYTAENPDIKIDAFLSEIGVYKRMTLDVIKCGMMNKIVIDKKRRLKAQYHDRIKTELQKK